MVVGTRHKYNLYKTLTTTNPTFEMDRAYSTKIEVTRFNPGLKSGAVKSVIRQRIFFKSLHKVVHSNQFYGFI